MAIYPGQHDYTSVRWSNNYDRSFPYSAQWADISETGANIYQIKEALILDFQFDTYISWNDFYAAVRLIFSSQQTYYGLKGYILPYYALDYSISPDNFETEALATFSVSADDIGKSVTINIHQEITGQPAANEICIGFKSSVAQDTISGLEVSIKQAYTIPTLVSPVQKYIDRASNNEFKIELNNPFGVTSDVRGEYNLDDGQGWRTLGTFVESGSYFPVPANTFPAQNTIIWRVRCQNGNSEWSDWYSAAFATIDVPIVSTPQLPTDDVILNNTQKIKFEWTTESDLGSAPTGSDIQWKQSGGAWSETIHVNGESTSYTFDENTFPEAELLWRVRSYNQEEVVGVWSTEASFKTTASPSVAIGRSPSGTIEDSGSPIVFSWVVSSQTGDPSYGAQLQYSTDGETWVELGTTNGEIVKTIPKDTFSAGTVYWRVRSKNRSQVWGDYCVPLSFLVKAAPIVNEVATNSAPFTTITWQSDDQQMYEISVDGETLGSFFGVQREYTLPEYLEDGEHVIGVRVLGSFDLWSRIAETQVTIENTPTSVLTLKAPTNIDTALEWTGGSGDFFVYRDGLMIAHTNAHSFTDRMALGSHDYQVVERLASGDYNASAVITRTPDVYCLHIAAMSGGEWIPISHTLKSDSDPQYSESQEVVYNHLAGIYEPVASIGQYRDDNGKYSAVFLFNEQEEHKRFRALRGKPVILKTADGEVVIGILHAWERKHVLNHYRYAERREMYAAYSFTIQRIGWGDYIDVPN